MHASLTFKPSSKILNATALSWNKIESPVQLVAIRNFAFAIEIISQITFE